MILAPLKSIVAAPRLRAVTEVPVTVVAVLKLRVVADSEIRESPIVSAAVNFAILPIVPLPKIIDPVPQVIILLPESTQSPEEAVPV